jgi:hypothetical protein
MFKRSITVFSSLVVAIGVPLLLGSGAIAAHLKGNIPAKRLKGDTYASPDGVFDLTVPPLMTPGAKAEERQLGQGRMTVVFYDDLGNTYYVIWTDNTQSKTDLETIAAEHTINESLREKQIVPTPRGSELRIALFRAGASPALVRRQVNGEITYPKLDLYEAHSLFVTDQYVYEVTAGVTAGHPRPDAEFFALAKEHLEAFLAGLHIKAPDPTSLSPAAAPARPAPGSPPLGYALDPRTARPLERR